MASESPPGLRELWRAADNVASKTMAFYIRAKVVAAWISGLAMLLVPVTLLAAFFLHNRRLGAAGIVFLAVEMANLAISHGVAIPLAFERGSWRGWNGESIRRRDDPTKFYGWTLAYTVPPVVELGCALFLIIVVAAQLLLPQTR